MAQERSSLTRRIRMLKHRYVSIGRGVALVACVGMILVVIATSMGSAIGGGTVVERNDATEQEGEVPSDNVATTGDENPITSRVLVHVDGAVAAPGVYEIAGDSPRVNDAVVSAGGLTADADTSQMNLAAPVHDGEKIHVPHAGDADTIAADGDRSQGGQASTYSAQPNTALVNINTASETDLQGLTGIGEATAAAIVQDRTKNGPFSSPEDLMRVSGIGEKKFEKLRDQICV